MRTIKRPTEPYDFRDLPHEEDDRLSRAVTPPMPPVDNHPEIAREEGDDSRKITARSIPPAALSSPGTFVELVTEIAEEHQDRVSEIARYLQRLSENFGDLHRAAMEDMRIYGKLLLAANVLEESQEAIRLLQFNIQAAGMEAAGTGSERPSGDPESIRETRSSIRALQKETEETTQRLEKFLRKPEDEDNRLVPEMHPGADSLVKREIGYFNDMVAANPEGVIRGTREMAAGCLDTIPVAVDRLVDYAVTEMHHYKTELAEIEGMHAHAAQKPEYLEELNTHYQQLLKQYEDCLGFTLKLVAKMPLRTQHLFLDQLDQQSLISLENQLSATITRIDSKEELDPKQEETKRYLEDMLKGVSRAKEQKKQAEGTTEELARHGQVFLRPPRVPKMTLPGLPAKGETEEE